MRREVREAMLDHEAFDASCHGIGVACFENIVTFGEQKCVLYDGVGVLSLYCIEILPEQLHGAGDNGNCTDTVTGLWSADNNAALGRIRHAALNFYCAGLFVQVAPFKSHTLTTAHSCGD